MSDGGKGDTPRPIVNREQFESNWETIFGKKKTGWPEGMLQDDNSALSRWFASKPDARAVVRNNLKDDND